MSELRIDLGCGPNPKPGFVGADAIAFPGAVVCNLGSERWPWDDNSVDEAHASHFLEHLTNFDGKWERVHFFNELYRVLKPGAKATLIFPHWCSNRYYGDPTHCFADDTDILAESGWKRVSEVKVGERVLSMDLATEVSEYVPVVGTIDEPYTGEMLHFLTDNVDLLVTPNHDMVWRAKGGNAGYWKRKGKAAPRPKLRKSPASSFVGMGGHHPRRGTAVVDWVGESPATVTVDGREFDTGDYAELVGWFVSEGHTWIRTEGATYYHVVISQCPGANPGKVARIRGLLKRMGIASNLTGHQIRFSSKDLACHFKKLGLCQDKYVPEEVKRLSPPLLKRFLESAILGDGSKNGEGWSYATTSKRLADDVQEIAAKSGYRTTLCIEPVAGKVMVIKGREFVARHDVLRVYISRPADLWYPPPKKVDYDGRISCVTLANHHNIYVRRNGRPAWSGNCEPFSEMGFYYLSREWRKVNAPHTDAGFNHHGYACEFEATWGYSMHAAIISRSSEHQQYAMQWHKEACQDIIATLTKRV